MNDRNKTKKQLIEELRALRRKVAELTEKQKRTYHKDRFRDLFENAPDMYIILDSNAKIIDFNQRGLKLLGYLHKEICGKPFTDIIHPEDQEKITKLFVEIYNTKKASKDVEVQMLHKSGKVLWVSQEFSLSKFKQGKSQAGVVSKSFPSKKNQKQESQVIRVLCRDVTEHKLLQEELARAQRLETAGRVAGQIAHDFNNLLAPLTAYPSLIREELSINHPVSGMLEEMEFAASKVAEINQQLLALGRRGHYTQEHIDLNDLVQKLILSQGLNSDIIVRQQLNPNLFLIKGGAAQLTRALTNLITNAKEAMKGQGILTIRTDNAYLEKPLTGYRTIERGEYVKLQVCDTGIGIELEFLDKIFDPFFTTKKMDRLSGSGLGLSVVHGIIEDHKGYITVDSTSGQGTTFSLYFPVSRELEGEMIDTIEKTKGGSENILIVDDDPVQRRVATQILKRLGYKVHTVASGEEAIRHVKKDHQDLLILDMVMDGMDGTETYSQILKFQPRQKAVILSGYAMSQRVQEALQLGAGAFISKPITLNTLATAVRKELDREKIRSRK